MAALDERAGEPAEIFEKYATIPSHPIPPMENEDGVKFLSIRQILHTPHQTSSLPASSLAFAFVSP